MRSIKAIFIKQAKDMLKNPTVLVMFIIFPAVAWVMTLLVAKSNEAIPNNLFVMMMSGIFAGMALISAASAIIAEDIERRSLRFMVIAGVKPQEYLIGTGGFLLLAGSFSAIMFALIADFNGMEIVKFLVIMIFGITASIILGTAIGMLSKNQQAATALATPIAMVLGFIPMIASFNESVSKFANIFYTQQISVIINDFSMSLTNPLLIILLNCLVFIALFIYAYKKKGLKD